MKATVIYGPPGTGKTTRLLGLVEEQMRSGVEPDRIAFISFTKAAVGEASARAMDKFGLSQRDLPWFRTIHSLAYSALSLSRGVVMATHKDFAEEHGFQISDKLGEGGEEIIFGERSSDDTIVYAKGLVDATGLPIEEVARRWKLQLPINRYELFCERLADWKLKQKKVSFADMLSLYVNGPSAPLDVDVAFIDEAQDLTPMQWKLARKALARARRVFIAGDDDQAIYNWAGADWSNLLNVRGDTEVLAQSHRVPRAVFDLAAQITKRISHRKDKQWNPKADEGQLKIGARLDNLQFDNGESWMCLARNSFALAEYANALRNAGLLFRFNGWPSVNKDMLNDWRAGRLPAWKARYLERVPDPEAKITIDVSTIHQVKGAEADNVVITPEISAATDKSLRSVEFSDDEHRVMYVGVTRAKKALFLLGKRAEYTYAFA